MCYLIWTTPATLCNEWQVLSVQLVCQRFHIEWKRLEWKGWISCRRRLPYMMSNISNMIESSNYWYESSIESVLISWGCVVAGHPAFTRSCGHDITEPACHLAPMTPARPHDVTPVWPREPWVTGNCTTPGYKNTLYTNYEPFQFWQEKSIQQSDSFHECRHL